MRQLTLPFTTAVTLKPDPVPHPFSHDGLCCEDARLDMEIRYAHLLEETDLFSRRVVSFQANKTETLHSWIKYREGFSAQLVETLLAELGIQPGQTILDPFAGSCTTLLEAKMWGIHAVGIELLPHCHLAWQVKANAFEYNVDELVQIRQQVQQQTPPPTTTTFPHLTITESAFPLDTERELMAYSHWFAEQDMSANARLLCQAILMSLLEEVSYTRKDGQYLRWDGRAAKIKQRNEQRLQQGKDPIQGIHKGSLPTVKQAFLRHLNRVIQDVSELQKQPPPASQQTVLEGSALNILPALEPDQFEGVITSPPYANRYDYTRTYALELAYLNVGDAIFHLRQQMLSCTVENKPKLNPLQEFYSSLDREAEYIEILNLVQTNSVLNEINQALHIRNQEGDVNNQGVLGMIDQYFTELTFIFAELFRVCRSGAHVAIVNDNVRYAGEVIPVDFLSTNLAETLGFEPVKVYVLPQQKGNSSQQMGKFGRRPLRKSITIWRKP
ncbi:MAG: modification methylase, putative [Chloroflexota bacterium]|nr:modification methylase [Chloroflexota bacterium]GIK56098.1 MAG: modification methylase, putative [Chloroflexota bacterium]